MPVTLKNLLKIGQLKEHPVSAEEIERLLIAAQRNLRDAHIKENSAETRFDVAYKAIMQCALAALMMHGYRPDTNRPGHHMTVLQSTPLTLGLAAKRVIVLDALRRQRNVADYTGDDVDDSTAGNCIREAKQLVDDVLAWRKTHRPDLILETK
jgi:uncharacterized protein (UPF0332 family)